MIVVKQKPIDDITAMVAKHRRVLIAGCNTCAAVALVGGEKQVNQLIEVLKLALSRQGSTVEFGGCVIQRQCEPEFVDECDGEGYDAILSLGCGAGVAHLSTVRDVPVYPAIDTLFLGSAKGMAHWQAECSACGSCVLGETAGICPVTRCAKGIMNGPCGGVDDGTCELGDRPCAWVEIYERQEELDRRQAFDKTLEPRDDSVRTNTPEWEVDPEGGSR